MERRYSFGCAEWESKNNLSNKLSLQSLNLASNNSLFIIFVVDFGGWTFRSLAHSNFVSMRFAWSFIKAFVQLTWLEKKLYLAVLEYWNKHHYWGCWWIRLCLRIRNFGIPSWSRPVVYFQNGECYFQKLPTNSKWH